MLDHTYECKLFIIWSLYIYNTFNLKEEYIGLIFVLHDCKPATEEADSDSRIWFWNHGGGID